MAAGGGEPGRGMIVGHVEPGRVDRRPAPLGEHAQRGLVGEQGLADALRAGEQPGMVKPARIERRRGRRRRPRHGRGAASQQILERGEQPCGHLSGAAARVDRSEALRLGLGERGEGVGDLAVIVGAAAADQVGALGVAAAGAVCPPRRRRAAAAACGREGSRGCRPRAAPGSSRSRGRRRRPDRRSSCRRSGRRAPICRRPAPA